MINEFSGSDIEEEEEQLVGGEMKQTKTSIHYQRPQHATARKKRRGIIEKRRRDRINNSLSELRRMVPTAYEKQGSTKLEKAEILQLTVEHLKILQSAMSKGYFEDLNSRTDYKSSGFRECVSEVARYLMTIEGMELQNPLRVRLMNHLQHLLKQKEAASATAKSFRIDSPLWPNLIGLNRNPANNMAADLYAHLQRHSPYSIPPHPAMAPMFSQAIVNKMIADQTVLNLGNGSPTKNIITPTKTEQQIKSSTTPFLFPCANLYQKSKESIASQMSSTHRKIEHPNFTNFGHSFPVLNPLFSFTIAGNRTPDFPVPRITPTATINIHKQRLNQPHQVPISSS